MVLGNNSISSPADTTAGFPSPTPYTMVDPLILKDAGTLVPCVGSFTSSVSSLLAFIENTCNESIQHLIDENNKTSVGVKCNLTHIKPNILGDEVECQSVIDKIEKNKYYFNVNVYYKGNIVGKCEHIRYEVNKNFYK